MVEFLEGNTLSKYLLDKYSKKPEGWSFTLFPSSSREVGGFVGALVGGPEEVWQIKLDSIFKPNPIMLGAKVDADPSKITKFPAVPYGYRKLDRGIAMQLLKALTTSDRDERDDLPNRLLLERIIGTSKPVAPIPGESYAEGPFVFTDRSGLEINPNQTQLEDKLSSELRKLVRNRYSSYG